MDKNFQRNIYLSKVSYSFITKLDGQAVNVF